MTLLLSSLCLFGAVGLLTMGGLERFGRGLARYEDRAVEATGKALDEMFLPLSPDQIAYLHLLAVVVPAAAGFLLTLQPLVALLLGAGGYFLPGWALGRLKKRRTAAFEAQLLEALPSLSNALRSGLSLLQAVETVGREAPAPFSQEARLTVREVNLGRDLDGALERLALRVRSEDLDLVATAIGTARRLGGNLSEIFDRIAATLRERNALKGKIQALTAQGRLQGILLGCLPVVLGGAMWFIDPHMIEVLFQDPIGWGILGAVAVLEGMAAFFIRRIAAIDV